MRKRLLRLLPLAPLAMLLFASPAMAQTTGTIIGVVTDASTGKPVPGALIIARSPNLQGEQTAVTDDKGNYRLPQLPPGPYTLAVQLGGYRPSERSDIVLRLDKTIRANLAVTPEAVQLEEQQVRTGVAPVINVGSAESGAVLTKEFVANVPVGRTFEAAAVSAPTAKQDTYGVGFAGAQSPENNYILDGLNVTDPRYGTNGVALLNNFVQEIDAKSGSFMPEYGRATGGVLNVVTKSGSNEFHGSIFGNYAPGMLSPRGQTVGRAGEAVAFREVPGNGGYDADFGFDLGGPILKDRLWFYAGFAPVLKRQTYERFLRETAINATPSDDPRRDDRLVGANGGFSYTTIPGTTRTFKSFDRSYQFNGKLTYLLDENNNVTVSGFGNPARNNDVFAFTGAPSRFMEDTETSSYDLIGRYSGKFLQKRLIVEAVGGWHRQSYADLPKIVDGIDQENSPAIRWRNVTSTSAAGGGIKHTIDMFEDVPAGFCVGDADKCTVDRYTTGGLGYIENLKLNRYSGKLSASYLVGLLGSHNWKAGVDYERTNYIQSKGYTGGAFYDYRPDFGFIFLRGYGTLNPATAVDGGTNDPAGVTFANNYRVGTTSIGNSTGLYLQDSWQVANTGLTLNGGVRWEFQSLKDQNSNATDLSINDNIAPRVQAIYDFTGTGRSKVSANWGRFYQAIPLDMADRAFGSETQLASGYDATTCGIDAQAAGFKAPRAFNPRTAGCALWVGDDGLGSDIQGNSVTWSQVGTVSPVAPDIKGMYVDQFGGSLEYELFQDFSVGFEYAGRRLGRAIEDMSSNDGTTYFIGNPGESKPFTYAGAEQNPRQVETTDAATGRQITVKFPKPVRDYDGFTFKVGKNLSNNWLAQASYTYSRLTGNYSGLFRPENDQLDPNITSEYDLPTLMTNKKGYLPGDITHQLKLFGAYVFNFGPKLNVTAGGAFNASSGRPVNALGAHPLYGNGEAFILQRGMAGRTPFVTSADLKGQLEYRLTGPYAMRFSVDIFNVFNTQETVILDENYTFDRVQPIIGAQCSGKSSAGKDNPIAALQADCPQIKYLKTTDGRPVSVNPNFGRAGPTLAAFQTPISFRFGLALTF